MMKKSLYIILFSLFVFSGVVYFMFSRSLPQLEGNLKLSSLENEVLVVRDKFGIPHIKANNRADLMKALGHTIASDRLFQMDVYRRVAAGELSEVFGESTLKVDKLFRTLGFKRLAQLKLESGFYNHSMLQDYKHFLQGVNEYIDLNPTPIEFVILGYDPRHFVYEDLLAYGGYLAYSFAVGLRSDLLLTKLSANLSESKLKKMMISPEADKKAYASNRINNQLIEKTLKQLVDSFSAFEGSNAWALSSKKSKSGFPILASDPHISFSNPGVWYEAHLQILSNKKDVDYEIYGHFIPLHPFPLLGHNRKLGWGITISYVDDMDFYKETIDKFSKKVKVGDKWFPLKYRNETIKVKDSADVQLPVIHSPNGPLMDELIEEKGISMKWAYYRKSNRVHEAFYKMGLATNIDEFKEAVSLSTAPGLNIVYADKEDNIALFLMGSIPIRKDGVSGEFVLESENINHQYSGYKDFSKHPHIVNPSSGLIVSANYRPTHSKKSIYGQWQPEDRYKTIKSKINKKEKWSLEDMKVLQTSFENINIEKDKSLFLSVLENNKSSLNSLDTEVLNRLKKWNNLAGKDDLEGAVFYNWKRNILKLALDELSDQNFKDFCGLSHSEHFYRRLIKLKNNEWWDLFSTSDKVEDRDDIIYTAFKETVSQLSSNFSDDISDWKWGELHTLELSHLLGKHPLLKLVFNKGPYELDGAFNTINNLRWVGCENGFKVKAGPSTRRLIDFSKPEKSLGIIPMGQSENILSNYFDDQTPIYLKNEYRDQLLNEEDFSVQAKVLKLTPAQR